MTKRGLLATIVGLVFALGLIAPVSGEERSIPRQNLNIAGLTVAFWKPPVNAPKPWPIIVFSHGFHGCNTQSTFLMEALAAAGYAVFAPNHRDAACGNLRAWLNPPEIAFGKPDEWNDATYRDRAVDIEKLLDGLKADPTYNATPYNWREVGLVGHSLGGYTVLGLGGAWPGWRDSRVKAVVALSPYSNPFIQRRTLGAMVAPAMYQGGTRDFGITPFVAKRDGAYDQTRPPKYYVEFDGAGHFAWTDLRRTYQAAIVEYTRAFLDRYLKGKGFPETLATPHPGVTLVRSAE